MKKLKLKLTNELWKSKHEIMGLKRKHSSIEMVEIPVGSHSVLKTIFEKYGPQLRRLSIYRCTLDDFTLITILKLSPFLQELFVSEVDIQRKLPEINPTNIVHLRSVSIHNTNWLIFKFLSRSQITSLLIKNRCDEGIDTRDILVSMLSYQYRLSELTLYGTSSKTLFEYNNLNNAWNNRCLSKFRIVCYSEKYHPVDSNVAEFLMLNNESLKHVVIATSKCVPIIQSTLPKLDNLKSLTLDVGSLVLDCQSKHVKMGGSVIDPTFARTVLEKFPSVGNLELDDWRNSPSTANMLPYVANNLPHLQELFITTICENLDQLNFTALQKLHIVYIPMNGMKSLLSFIEKTTSLNTLKIGLVHIGQVKSICKIIEHTKIQHLSFAGNAKNLKTIFDFIRQSTPKVLRTLELCIRSNEIYTSFSNTLRKSVQIDFPLDRQSSPDLQANLDTFFGEF